MNMMNRINRSLTALYLDCAASIKQDKKALGISGAVGLGIGTIPVCLSVAMATQDPQDIEGLGRTVSQVLAKAYTSLFGVVTVFTAIMIICALIVRMNANTQRAQQATQWLTRIIVCYVAINCIGVILKVIDGSFSKYRY